MDVRHDCLNCGAVFEGRPNRAYCSTRCKEAAKRLRRRVRKLEALLDHAQRHHDLAKLARRPAAVRVQAWRVRQIQAELEVVENGAKRGA